MSKYLPEGKEANEDEELKDTVIIQPEKAPHKLMREKNGVKQQLGAFKNKYIAAMVAAFLNTEHSVEIIKGVEIKSIYTIEEHE